MYRKVLVLVVVASTVAFGAQENYSPYLGYEVQGQWCNSAGVPIHYTDQGTGTPVIMLHGFAMTTDITWRGNGVIDYLSRNHRVIAMDLRGHGLSGKPHQNGAYGVEMCRDVIRLMDSLGIEKAHIIGNSLGGLVAIKTAALYPDRILSLTSCGMGWARYADKHDIVKALASAIDSGDGVRPLVQYLRPKDDPLNGLALAALNTLVLSFNDAQALAAMTRQTPELEVSEHDLRHLPMPVLNITGSRDPLMPDVEEMDRLVPHHWNKVVDGADHFNLSGQQETRETIETFLRAVPTPSEVALPAAA